MLSQGKWHLRVPKDQVKNLEYRISLLKRCEKDRDLQRGILELCKNDILFWINSWVWTYNPTKLGHEVGPFITWDFQDRALIGGHVPGEDGPVHEYGIVECIEEQKDVRWPKSRELGASWLVLLAIVWLCLFHARKKAFVLSRDEDAVDRPDDPDCLFWKVSFILEHLPDWMSQGAFKRKMGFRFERTKSTIFGEANTKEAGVGGRASVALFDEFGRFKNGYDIYGATASMTNCRVFVFTHDSAASMAYDLCYDEKYHDMRQIMTHWSQHPDKKKGLYRYDAQTNKIEVLDGTFDYPKDFRFMMSESPTGGPFPGLRSPWYDEQCKRMPERYVRMHLDIDPQGASSQFFDSGIIARLKKKHCVDPYWEGELVYDKSTGKPIEFVRKPGGKLKLWMIPRQGAVLPLGTYRMGFDVSAGSGATNSCASVLNVKTGEKVAEYANPDILPADFGVYAVALGQTLRSESGETAMMCWEIQGSQAFAKRVIELGYLNVYYRKDEDALGKQRDNARRPGVTASPKMIDLMMNAYRDALYKGLFINRSTLALEEALSFVYSARGVEYKKRGAVSDEDTSGAGMHHGDRTKADVTCWHIAKEPFKAFQSEVREVDEDWIDPRSMDGRMRLAEESRRELEIEIGA